MKDSISSRARAHAGPRVAMLVGLIGFAASPAWAREMVPDTASVREIVQQMQERYGGPRYKTLTFMQRTIKYPKSGVADTTIWYEAVAQGRLRIDTDLETSSGAIFVDGMRHSFKNGELVGSAPDINPLAVVLGDLYSEPISRGVALLDSLGFDISVVREDEWDGMPVWVIGASPGDERSAQVWIEKERLLPVRLVTPLPQGPVLEARIGGYTDMAGSWVETEIIVFVDGKLYQTEEYVDVRVNPVLDDELFDPEMWQARGRYWE